MTTIIFQICRYSSISVLALRSILLTPSRNLTDNSFKETSGSYEQEPGISTRPKKSATWIFANWTFSNNWRSSDSPRNHMKFCTTPKSTLLIPIESLISMNSWYIAWPSARCRDSSACCYLYKHIPYRSPTTNPQSGQTISPAR
jgi:hypothetical protein